MNNRESLKNEARFPRIDHQIVGTNGEVIRDLEQEYGERTLRSFCIGDVTTPAELQKQFDVATADLRAEKAEIEGKIWQHTADTFTAQYPEYAPIVNNGADPSTYDVDAAQKAYWNHQHEMREQFAAERERIAAINVQIAEQKLQYVYAFPDHDKSKMQLAVGSEAVGISAESTTHKSIKHYAADVVRYIEQRLQIIAERGSYYNGSSRVNGTKLERMTAALPQLKQWLETLEASDAMPATYVQQIEVLPAYRGKGNAQALLDAIEWDAQRNVGPDTPRYSYGIVMGENYEGGDAMEAIFKKNGYVEIYSPESGTPEYSLWLKGHAGASVPNIYALSE